jgi:hypothetical protein
MARRLVAVLSADVAGYSRLMEADEERTLAALKAIRRELGDPKIDAAYQSLLRRTRQQYRRQVAELLESTSPTRSRPIRNWWRTTTAKLACLRRRSPIGNGPARTRQGARPIWRRSDT